MFVSSYKVRLPRFRKKYKLLFNLSVGFLVINYIAVLSNKYVYLFLDKPKRHFAYKNHIAKELSQKLEDNGINCVKTEHRMQLRLEFYGIGECDENKLTYYKDKNSIDVTISYFNKPVYIAYVTKLNNE
jgi:hypothetical protein